MEHGGIRPGAGRPKGSQASHTLKAQAFQERLIERVLEEQEPIIEALISQAKEGKIPALKEIFERVLGRVRPALGEETTLPISILAGYEQNRLFGNIST